MRTLFRSVSVVAAVVLGLTACEDPFDGNDPDENPGYRVVEDDPEETIGIDELINDNELPDAEGSPELYVRLNRTGYEVREYPVEYRGMDYYDLIIALKNPEDVRVGHGDSGSPIVDADGRVVAALYAGDATNKEIFFARPIGDMTSQLTTASVQAAASVTGREPLLSRHFVGIGADTLSEIRSSLGLPREQIVAHREVPSAGDASTTRVGASQGQARVPIAGNSILLRYLDGDIFHSYTSGTITYTTGDYSEGEPLLAFGHGILGSGTASVPADLVPAVAFIESDRYPYKVVDPLLGPQDPNGIGGPLGFVVQEAYSGAAVKQTRRYSPTEVVSTVNTPSSSMPIGANHVVAPTTRSSQDHYFQTMAILAPLVYHWEDAYNQDGDVTVSFNSFRAAGGGDEEEELATDAGGIRDIREDPLVITYDEYLSGEQEITYLGYIANEVYQLIRDTYRGQPADTPARFLTIDVQVELSN